MSETDQRISNFAAVSDQDQVYDQLKDLMGLRGHLQDEILRIQAMMSQDDPGLNVSLSHPIFFTFAISRHDNHIFHICETFRYQKPPNFPSVQCFTPKCLKFVYESHAF